MHDLWTTIVKTSGAKCYSMMAALLTLFLTARLLGPDGRGTVAAITAWVGMFSTFGCLSLGQVALHRLSEYRERAQYGALLGSLLFFSVLIGAIGWLMALACGLLENGGIFRGLPPAALSIGFAALPLLVWEQYSNSLLMALEQLHIYNRYEIIGRTIGVIGILFLVGAVEAGVYGALAAGLVGQIIISLGGLSFLISEANRRGQRVAPSGSEIKALVLGGCKLHLNAIGTFLFSSATILMINHYQGVTETGYYQLALQLMSAMMIVPHAACMVIYGKVAKVGPNAAWTLHRRVLLHTTILMIGSSLVVGWTAPWWLVLLAGESFRPSVQLFRWMLLGAVGMTFSVVMAPQWIGRGLFLQATILTAVIGVANFLANIFLIPRYGTMGAVSSFLGTYLISIFGNGIMAIYCNSVRSE